MSDNAEWCLIESDPGVFTELIRNFGVRGVQVEELYSLDEEAFANLNPVHGLIFLFKYREGEEISGELDVANPNEVFFAQQVISNACATQAIINLLLNVDSPDVTLGTELEEFKNFTSGFDPANRGLCLNNCENIRTMHNSFARQTLFELDLKGAQKEDNYHFVTYVPVKGHVYELDGLRDGPIDHGPIPEGGNWIDAVRPIIQQRMERFTVGEIHFNLMAIISDRRVRYQRELNELIESGMDTDDAAHDIYRLQTLISEEEEKWDRQRRENVRRRHNYVPFIVQLMKCLAKEEKLTPLVENAIFEFNRKEVMKQYEFV